MSTFEPSINRNYRSPGEDKYMCPLGEERPSERTREYVPPSLSQQEQPQPQHTTEIGKNDATVPKSTLSLEQRIVELG